jgi:hypothetical protein
VIVAVGGLDVHVAQREHEPEVLEREFSDPFDELERRDRTAVIDHDLDQ